MEDELPIKLGPVSNGEFFPVPHDDFLREVTRRTNLLADENARRTGMSRRRFLGSAAGAATMLFVLAACSGEKNAAEGNRSGGTFNVPEESTVSSTAALDTENGRAIMTLLTRIAKDRRRGVLVVTHDPRILPFADRIVRIEDGRIVGEAESGGGCDEGEGDRAVHGHA